MRIFRVRVESRSRSPRRAVTVQYSIAQYSTVQWLDPTVRETPFCAEYTGGQVPEKASGNLQQENKSQEGNSPGNGKSGAT